MVFTNSTPFPTVITPLSNISPFTYRDGFTYLEILEKMRKWLNETLVPDFNAGIANAITEFQKGIENAETRVVESENAHNILVANALDYINTNVANINSALASAIADNKSYMDTKVLENKTYVDTETLEARQYVDAIVDVVNNKTGNVQIQRATINAPYTINIDPLWPSNHPVHLAIKQDATGGRAITLGANVQGKLDIDNSPNGVTDVTLFPNGNGQWDVFQLSTFAHGYNIQDKRFGAKADNANDDTAAVQKAVDVVSAQGGGAVYAPRGTSKITQIRMKSNVKIYGDGEKSRFASINGDVPMFILDNDTVENVTIENIAIIGNRTPANTNNHGIYFVNGSNGGGKHKLRNLRIEQMGGSGIWVTGLSGGAGIVANVSTYFCDSVGLRWGSHDSIIYGIDCGQSGSTGIRIEGGNNRFSNLNAWFSGRLAAANGHGVYVVGGKRNTLTGFQAQDNTGAGLLIWADETVAEGFTIDGANSIGEGVISGNATAGVILTASKGCRVDGQVTNRFGVLTTPYALDINSSSTGNTIRLTANNMSTGGATGTGLTDPSNTIEINSATQAHRVGRFLSGKIETFTKMRPNVATGSTGTVVAAATGSVTGIEINAAAIGTFVVGQVFYLELIGRPQAGASYRHVARIPAVVFREAGNALITLGDVQNVVNAGFATTAGNHTVAATVAADGTTMDVSITNNTAASWQYNVKIL